MKSDGKLSLALHALGHMAQAPDGPMTSEAIAQFHSTNPVVVRRVLGLLRDRGIVASEKGHAGGWRLSRAPGAITIADIYDAIGEPFLRPIPINDQPHCAVVAAMRSTVGAAMAEAEEVLRRHLSTQSVADLARAMAENPRNPPSNPRDSSL